MMILRIYSALLIAASPIFFWKTEKFSDNPTLPGSVDSLYARINATEKSDLNIADLFHYASFKETKIIPLSLRIANSEFKVAVKSKNYFIIQNELPIDFFSDSHDLQIWNILFDQVASFKEKKLLESGVINMGMAVYYLRLTYTENDSRICATYSMAIRDRYLIEIIHLDSAVKRYPRFRRSASVYSREKGIFFK